MQVSKARLMSSCQCKVPPGMACWGCLCLDLSDPSLADPFPTPQPHILLVLQDSGPPPFKHFLPSFPCLLMGPLLPSSLATPSGILISQPLLQSALWSSNIPTLCDYWAPSTLVNTLWEEGPLLQFHLSPSYLELGLST